MPELVAQSIVSGIAIGCVYGLIGIGFCVIYNASGIVNFAQGAFVMLGGMVTYVGADALRPAAAARRAHLDRARRRALGVVLERLVVRPLWNRNSTMFVMILATLAAQIVIERADAARDRRSAAHAADVHRLAAAAHRWASRSATSSSGSSAARRW